jgi:hypothetical protein
MNARAMSRLGWGLGIGLAVLPWLSYGYPTSISHSHNSDIVEWESDQAAPHSNSAHNHRADRDFGGITQWEHEPYSAYSCWDNSTWRVTNSGQFLRGHCHIDETV